VSGSKAPQLIVLLAGDRIGKHSKTRPPTSETKLTTMLTKATLALALLSGAAAAPAPRASKAHGLIISKEQDIDEAWCVPHEL